MTMGRNEIFFVPDKEKINLGALGSRAIKKDIEQ